METLTSLEKVIIAAQKKVLENITIPKSMQDKVKVENGKVVIIEQNEISELQKKLAELLEFKSEEERLDFEADMIQLDIMDEVRKITDGMTEKEVAEKIGITKTMLSRLKTCESTLTLEHLAKIQRAFKIKFKITVK